MKVEEITDVESKDGEVTLPEKLPEIFENPEDETEQPVVEETEVQAEEEQTAVEEAPVEEAEAGTLHPVVTYAKQNPVMVGALGVVLAVLGILIFTSLKGKKKAHAEDVQKEEAEQISIATQPQSEEEQRKTSPVTAASIHEQGYRKDQQDSFGISDYMEQGKGLLAVVADGMGGLSNGKAVSSKIIETCFDVFYSLPNYISHEDMLLQMAVKSNEAVNQMLRAAGKSGSTLVGAVIGNGQLHFLTIGDSRIYLYRGGALLQLNREHIYREELSLSALNGKISIHQANHDPQGKSLTSYLGIGQIPYLDRNFEGIRLISGDKILLSSDGVFGTLTQEQMEMALQQPADEATKTLGELVAAANKPYQDNYTAVVLEYHG